MKLTKFQFIIFLIVLILGTFLRFNNFTENIQFHLDPPLFTREVKDMVDEGKLRLIGPMVASKEIQGRVFFTGPYFYWLLAVLGIVSNWNLVFMTGFFAILWTVTFIVVFLWLKKKFGFWPSFSVFTLLIFSNYFVAFSRIIWNTHFTPLFGVIILYLLENRKNKYLYYLLAGIFFGLGVSIHYGSILWTAFLIYFLLLDIKNKKFDFKNWLLLIFGVAIVQIPYILFELKHDFYNIRTVIFHLQNFGGESAYTHGFFYQYYYYLFPFFPLLCIGYAKALVFIGKKIGNNKVIISQVIFALVLFYQSAFTPRAEALINPPEWDIKTQQRIVDLVAADNEKGFEIAALVGPDTRAYELRWWLRLKNIQPMSVIDYDKTDILYVVVPSWRNVETETVCEIQSIKPFKIDKKIQVNNNLYLYKLLRLKGVQ